MPAETGHGAPLSVKAETLASAQNVAARVSAPTRLVVQESVAGGIAAAAPDAVRDPAGHAVPQVLPSVVPPGAVPGPSSCLPPTQTELVLAPPGDFFGHVDQQEKARFEQAVRTGAWDHDDLDLSVPEEDQSQKPAQTSAAQVVIPTAAVLFANLPNGAKDAAAGALLTGMANVVDAATRGGEAIKDVKESAAHAGAQVLKDVNEAARSHPGLTGLKDVAETAIVSGATAFQEVKNAAAEIGEHLVLDVSAAASASISLPSKISGASRSGLGAPAPFDRYGEADEPRRLRGRESGSNDEDEDDRKDKSRADGGNKFPLNPIATGIICCALICVLALWLPSISRGAVELQLPWAGQASQTDIATFPRGNWNLIYKTDQGAVSTDMIVRRRGDLIYGGGRDAIGDYHIEGQVIPRAVQFAKKYTHGSRQSAPITYKGYATQKPEGIRWTGAITVEPVRRKLRAPIVRTIGVWEASYAGARGLDFFDFKYFNEDDWRDFFGICAAALVGLGVLAYIIALKLFGLNGWLNQRAKNEYVPSQFKGEHKKMLAEFGRPLKAGSIPIGVRTEWKPWFPFSPRALSIPPDLRKQNPHVLVVGGTHKGKTRVVANMAAHDIESGDRGVVVLDSDGTIVDLLTDWIAAHPKGAQLAKRVIILDGSQTSNIHSFNPLSEYGADLQGLANSIVYGFKAIYTEPPGSQSQWSPQTANILRNAAQVLAANNCTLADLPRLLQDNDYRDILLDRIEKMKHERPEYPMLLESWSQYKKLARTDQWITWVEPILNRLTPSLGDSRIRPLLSTGAPPLDLEAVIKESKILLVRLPKGQLHEAGNLFGSLLITGLKHTATMLGTRKKAEPLALYIDEFDNLLALETIESLVQESSRVKIGLIAVAKTLQGIPEEFRQKMTLSFGTLIAFSLAKKDADLLGPQMFRVDGRKRKHTTLTNWICQVNSSPQFELISDEEKLGVDRLVGQEDRKFFCYKVGSTAGVFHARSFDFRDVKPDAIKQKLVERMLSGRSN